MGGLGFICLNEKLEYKDNLKIKCKNKKNVKHILEDT